VVDLAQAVEWVTAAAPVGNLESSFNLLPQGESQSKELSPFLSFRRLFLCAIFFSASLNGITWVEGVERET